MRRLMRHAKPAARSLSTAKYDAHHTVLDKTYGALADLRRELADSKSAVAERTELLEIFATCADSQRAWLLLEDYFESLSLARKDFSSQDWWPRLMAVQGKRRLEELAMLFLRTNRPLPTELIPYADLEQFAAIEQSQKEQEYVRQLEHWLLPPAPAHLDSPRAALRVFCEARPISDQSKLFGLAIQFSLFRPRTGEKLRALGELTELTQRAAHEQELFSPADWQFIQWLAETFPVDAGPPPETLLLTGTELFKWLALWGNSQRLEQPAHPAPLTFAGQVAELTPHLENGSSELALSHRLTLPDGGTHPLSAARFFAGLPSLALIEQTFYLVRNSPPAVVLDGLTQGVALPVKKLGHRLLTHLRKTGSRSSAEWDHLCVTHTAKPQFLFELDGDTVRLRLLAVSERDESHWHWNGHEWQRVDATTAAPEKPDILDDARLEAAIGWLRQLDWFTPEPGLWLGDASENFLNTLATAWPERPAGAEFLGNAAFQRLFLAPRQLRPRVMVQGSGIDWFSVSTEWEQEGLKLTAADLQSLQNATGRFVKLPDSGWVELDTAAVRSAHEVIADLGLEDLNADAQRVDLVQALQLSEETLTRFGDQAQAQALRERLTAFSGVPVTPLPETVQAEMRPYQKDGFDFLCHLTRLKLGGVLADDMGLGKTLQTLAWLAWLQAERSSDPKPSLVICPASVLHNWRREANRFTPHLKVLVLESGAARHNLRKQIPQHDITVTNYALLRRDLEALQRFEFRAVILDEAQFIKNPGAQVTQSVKRLAAEHRLALTGTPLENRLLDLWSIIDFVQPGYLGTQSKFSELYEPRGEDAAWAQKMARRRLAAKVRPLMLDCVPR